MVGRLAAMLGGRRGASPEARGKPGETSGGHGDHWGCIFRGDAEPHLAEFLNATLDQYAGAERFDAPGRGGGLALLSEGAGLAARLLVVKQRVITAYPEVEGGPVWPVTVRELVRWANGCEGQVTGECHGAVISFFDTRFYANARHYRTGETYDFRMAAFAYTIDSGPEWEIGVDDLGAKVSAKGAHAYMPAFGTNPRADIDDFWFHAPLEGEPRAVKFAGQPLIVFPVTLALPDEFPMTVDVVAAPHAMGPGISGAHEDDDVEGFLWLQGYLES